MTWARCRERRGRLKWSAWIARSSCIRKCGSARAITICSTISWSIAGNRRSATATTRSEGRWVAAKGRRIFVTAMTDGEENQELEHRALKFFNLRAKNAEELHWEGPVVSLATVTDLSQVLGPDAKELGTLTPPREFNLMFKTIVGALGGEDDAAFLRPETAQGIFVNFKNVVDSSRVRVPFGIAQIGKSFRNEITPRNFTFRSREFEQMEIEFFCHPAESAEWYRFWRDRRYNWYLGLGLAGERLRLREHRTGRAEPLFLRHGRHRIRLSLPAGGRIWRAGGRGPSRRLRPAQPHGRQAGHSKPTESLVLEKNAEGKPRHRGSGKDLSYFDDQTQGALHSARDRAVGGGRPGHAGLPVRGLLRGQSPRRKRQDAGAHGAQAAPPAGAVQGGHLSAGEQGRMPEIAQRLYRELKPHFNVFYDDKGAVGRRYRRQDEAGTPFCFTIDGQTLQDQTVTIRNRDTLEQSRMPIAAVLERAAQTTIVNEIDSCHLAGRVRVQDLPALWILSPKASR